MTWTIEMEPAAVLSPPGRDQSIFASVGTALTCCSGSCCLWMTSVEVGASQTSSTPLMRKGWIPDSSPGTPLTGRTWRTVSFPVLSGAAVTRSDHSSLCFSLFQACLTAAFKPTIWGAQLWRRLEEAPSWREYIQKVLKLLLHVLG